MATVSGTNLFDLDILEIIEEAYEQAGVEARSGYDMRTARRSLDLLFIEWGNKGYNLWTIVEDSLVLTPGVGAYTLDAAMVDVVECVLRDANRDTSIRRIPLNTHANRTDKTVQGRPSQLYVDRQRTGPVINLWPIPDEAYTFTYWVMRSIFDTGDFINGIDTPKRFLPAIIAGLSVKLAAKKNKPAVPGCEKEAARLWDEATSEDRDRSDTIIYPELIR